MEIHRQHFQRFFDYRRGLPCFRLGELRGVLSNLPWHARLVYRYFMHSDFHIFIVPYSQQLRYILVSYFHYIEFVFNCQSRYHYHQYRCLCLRFCDVLESIRSVLIIVKLAFTDSKHAGDATLIARIIHLPAALAAILFFAFNFFIYLYTIKHFFPFGEYITFIHF